MENGLPSDVYESLPERLIREAIETGDGVPDDDLWWVREWLERKRAKTAGG